MLQTGQIEAKYQVSRDTLRFYIEEGLVLPDKVAGKYQWLPEHEAASTNILELRALGLSVNALRNCMRRLVGLRFNGGRIWWLWRKS